MSWHEKYLSNQQNFEILSATEKAVQDLLLKKNFIVHIIKGSDNSPLISIEKILPNNSQQTETHTILTIPLGDRDRVYRDAAEALVDISRNL